MCYIHFLNVFLTNKEKKPVSSFKNLTHVGVCFGGVKEFDPFSFNNRFTSAELNPVEGLTPNRSKSC